MEEPNKIVTGDMIDKHFGKPVIALGYDDIKPTLEDLNPVNDMLHDRKITLESVDDVIPTETTYEAVTTDGTVNNNTPISSGINIASTLTDEDKVEAILHSQMQYDYMIGCIYRHFKGHVYKVISISINTETLEPDISYQRVDGTSIDRNIIWTRKLSMFLEPVDKTKYPDADQEMRFQKI